MLFSIGYQGMKDPSELVAALEPHGVKILVDVRSKPNSRWKPLFNKKHLTAFLATQGIKYFWRGDKLGGFEKIEDADLQSLAEWQEGRMVCLMCMERNPDECHRKYEIARRLEPLGVEVTHLPIKAPEAVQAKLF